jgi:hypothetical protein
MADWSIFPNRSMLAASPAASLPAHAGRPPRPAPHGEDAKASGAQEPALDDAQLRDAILLKISLEGKDYTTARREALGERQAARSAAASSDSQQAEPDVILDVSVTSLQAVHVEGELTTPKGRLAFEATSIVLSREHLSVSGASQRQDPLLIDLDGTGPATTGAEGAHPFDLSGKGKVLPTSFVQGGSAFLALDRNGDGTINDGGELFGDQHGAADGYAELRKFDSDGNGRIDAQDPVYSELKLLYGDQSTLGLGAAGIRSISLQATPTAQLTASGDGILGSATAETADGRTLHTYAMGLQSFNLLA